MGEVNRSAVAGLDERFEESATLHPLRIFPRVGRSLKTTNVLKSVTAQPKQRFGQVDHGKNPNKKCRWVTRLSRPVRAAEWLVDFTGDPKAAEQDGQPSCHGHGRHCLRLLGPASWSNVLQPPVTPGCGLGDLTTSHTWLTRAVVVRIHRIATPNEPQMHLGLSTPILDGPQKLGVHTSKPRKIRRQS